MSIESKIREYYNPLGANNKEPYAEWYQGFKVVFLGPNSQLERLFLHECWQESFCFILPRWDDKKTNFSLNTITPASSSINTASLFWYSSQHSCSWGVLRSIHKEWMASTRTLASMTGQIIYIFVLGSSW